MTVSRTHGLDLQKNTGQNGKERTRFQIRTQLDFDTLYLGKLFPSLIDDSETVEMYTSSSGGSYFIFDFPEDQEDRVERLIGYSSTIVSYHLQHRR